MTGTRSTGCLTCRKRKVKCDEARPVCERCTKAGLHCQGYHKAIVFVDERQRRGKLDARRQTQWQQTGHHLKKIEDPPLLDRTLGPLLPPTAFQRDFLITFLLDRLFDGRHGFQNTSWWVLKASDLQTPGLALDALITMFFGRAIRHPPFIKEGINYYSKALVSLRHDLNSAEAFSFGTLATTSTLSMYELIASSSPTNWIKHAGGLARLIQSRGPKLHKSGMEKKIFLENRSLLVSQAMLERQRTFLGERQWKEVPWEDAPETKDPYDYLLDVGADAACLLEDVDQFCLEDVHRVEASESQQLASSLASRLGRCFEDLDAWWRAWATKHLDSCFEKAPSREKGISFDDEGPVWESVLWYDSFWTSYVMVGHNAMRIALLQLWQQLSKPAASVGVSLQPPSDEPNPMPLLGISSNSLGLALEILRSIEFCESRSKRFLGTSCLLFPMYYARKCLVRQSREDRWVHTLPAKTFESPDKLKSGSHLQETLPTCGTMMMERPVSVYQFIE